VLGLAVMPGFTQGPTPITFAWPGYGSDWCCSSIKPAKVSEVGVEWLALSFQQQILRRV